jgi:DNA-binding response OmpR family regulator
MEEEVEEASLPRVLVIDPAPRIATLATQSLTGAYDVAWATSFTDGITLAKLDPPAVVVLDLRSDKDGSWFQQLTRCPELAQTKFMGLCLRMDHRLKDRAREEGIDSILHKPFQPWEFQAGILRLCEKRGLGVMYVEGNVYVLPFYGGMHLKRGSTFADFLKNLDRQLEEMALAGYGQLVLDMTPAKQITINDVGGVLDIVAQAEAVGLEIQVVADVRRQRILARFEETAQLPVSPTLEAAVAELTSRRSPPHRGTGPDPDTVSP